MSQPSPAEILQQVAIREGLSITLPPELPDELLSNLGFDEVAPPSPVATQSAEYAAMLTDEQGLDDARRYSPVNDAVVRVSNLIEQRVDAYRERLYQRLEQWLAGEIPSVFDQDEDALPDPTPEVIDEPSE